MSTLPTLHYHVKGSGPSIVLLHGFCESLKIWDAFANSLSQTYQVISIDLPGFGKSSFSSPSIDGFADEVQSVLMHLSVEKCIMIGHSMGGYVTLAYAEKYPDQLLGMGLFHSSAYADAEENKIKRDQGIQSVTEHGTVSFVQGLLPKLFPPQSETIYQGVMDELVKDMEDIPPENVANALLAMKKRPDRTHILKTVDFPVLFIVGKLDQVIPLEKTIAQYAFPNDSIVHFLGDVAHMGMFEAPATTLKTIELFLTYCLEQ